MRNLANLVSADARPGILASPPDPAPAGSEISSDTHAGWGWITFPLVNTQVLGTPTEVLRSGLFGFDGLPVIGFALVERNNSAEAGNNRNYGSTKAHLIRLLAR